MTEKEIRELFDKERKIRCRDYMTIQDYMRALVEVVIDVSAKVLAERLKKD